MCELYAVIVVEIRTGNIAFDITRDISPTVCYQTSILDPKVSRSIYFLEASEVSVNVVLTESVIGNETRKPDNTKHCPAKLLTKVTFHK